MHVLKLEAESVITVFVLFVLIELHNLNEDALLSLCVLENELSSGLLVVLASLSNVLLVAELNSLIVNGDFTVTAVLSNNLDLDFLLGWRDLDSLGILKANLSRLVIIDDGDASLGVLSNKFLVGVWLVELHEEVLIWLPVVVILNANVESFDVFAISEYNNVIIWEVVLVFLGITVHGAGAYVASNSLLINNSNSKLSRRLTDGIMQALETEVVVFYVLVKLIGMCVLKLHLLVFSNYWSLAGHKVIDLLSIFDSADHTLTLNNLFKFFKADLVNLIGLHGLFKESLHLVSLFNGLLVLWRTTLLLNEQILVNFISGVLNNWFIFFFLSSLLCFSLLGCESISSIGKDNKDHEEHKGENSL